MALLFSLLCLVHVCLAYPGYQDRIPNANNVKHPCIPNYRWPGVGHENRNGGGARNVFGQAFANAGHQWTKTLCQQDSDGDGRSNGEELGDPACVWSAGQVPSRRENITNPGVCEPLNDQKCAGKNSYVSCQLDSFDNCNVIKNSDIQTVDLTFPNYAVPPTETNYICMSFNLPSDKDYHIVATQAIINNSNVLHHMALHGCEEENSTFFSTPQTCGMSSSVCNSIIGGWTVGQSGQCYGDFVGFRIGVTGFRSARLEIHYNNPNLESNVKDSSGLRIYIRPARSEVQDIFTLMTGQLTLELPPGQSRIEKVGVCKSTCTSALFNKPAYIISGLNHMHYLGRSMKIELYRNGSLISNLTNDEFYSYDSPVSHRHSPQVKILPGDEIITKCVFNTQSSNRWVYFGESTSDEMCLGFLTIYPKSALNYQRPSCVAKSSMSYCELNQGTPLNGCDWANFINSNNPETVKMASDLNKNCNLDGFCRPECESVVNRISAHPCFQGETVKFVKSFMVMYKEGLEFIGRLQSCPATQSLNCTQQCPKLCNQDHRDKGTYAGAVSVYPPSGLVPLILTLTAVLSRFIGE